MKFETGGHIFERNLNPLNIEEDGRTYLDAHKEWYGKREEEIIAKNAMKVQFCVSNEELLDKLSDTIIKKPTLNGKMKKCSTSTALIHGGKAAVAKNAKKWVTEVTGILSFCLV